MSVSQNGPNLEDYQLQCWKYCSVPYDLFTKHFIETYFFILMKLTVRFCFNMDFPYEHSISVKHSSEPFRLGSVTNKQTTIGTTDCLIADIAQCELLYASINDFLHFHGN